VLGVATTVTSCGLEKIMCSLTDYRHGAARGVGGR
jgi:hypothetical protein